MSGRSKPPFVQSGIQLRAKPGRKTGRPYVLFWLAPAGIRRFNVSCLLWLSELLATVPGCFSHISARSHHRKKQAVPFLCHCRDSRHPYLAYGCVPGGWGTFLSSVLPPPSAALSLSRLNGTPEMISAAIREIGIFKVHIPMNGNVQKSVHSILEFF